MKLPFTQSKITSEQQKNDDSNDEILELTIGELNWVGGGNVHNNIVEPTSKRTV